MDLNNPPPQVTVEDKKLSAARKRTIKLLIFCVMTIGARFLIKDPPPPKPVEHLNAPLRIVPGMLQNIPLSEQQKLKPEILAKLHEADEMAERPTMLAAAPYKAAPVIAPSLNEKELTLEYNYQSKQRQRKIETVKDNEIIDINKTTLVSLVNGRHIKAENAITKHATVSIKIQRNIVAALPQKMVASVSENALTWQEPVPHGYTRLKPARGITIELLNETAKRISVPKPDDES